MDVEIKNATGKQPIPTIIVNTLIENSFIDSAERVQVIDEWRYRVADFRTWSKKETFLTRYFQPALTNQGWNLEVDVQILPAENEDAIIDISRSKCKPYYSLWFMDAWGNEFYYFSHDKDKLYLKAIENILHSTEDEDARSEEIAELLHDDNCDETSILPVESEVIIHKEMVWYIDYDSNDDEIIAFLDPNDYDEEEWDELIEEIGGVNSIDDVL